MTQSDFAPLRTERLTLRPLGPADAPELDVFTGQRNIEATLPGSGTLKIAGSSLPREFLQWCRLGGAAAPLPPEAEPSMQPPGV